MVRKSSAWILTLLLAFASSLLADDHGKKGKGEKAERGKVERKIEVERHDEGKLVRRVVVARPVVVPNTVVVQNVRVRTTTLTLINTDVNRLESILVTAQNTPVILSQPTLIRVANEASALSNRIVARVNSAFHGRALDPVTAARNLRIHIRELHKAAAAGNAAAVQAHAREALQFAVRLDQMV